MAQMTDWLYDRVMAWGRYCQAQTTQGKLDHLASELIDLQQQFLKAKQDIQRLRADIDKLRQDKGISKASLLPDERDRQ